MRERNKATLVCYKSYVLLGWHVVRMTQPALGLVNYVSERKVPKYPFHCTGDVKLTMHRNGPPKLLADRAGCNSEVYQGILAGFGVRVVIPGFCLD